MRWIASMVAEAHRILMRGGVFMYPRDTKDPSQARPPAPAVRGQPDRLHDGAGRRPRQHRAPAACWACKPTSAAPAHRPGVRLEERGRAHRALPPEPATGERDRCSSRRCSPSAACSATEPFATNQPCQEPTPPHHRHHRLVRRRHHLGDAHLREHLPPREGVKRRRSSKATASTATTARRCASARPRPRRPATSTSATSAREQPVRRAGGAVPHYARPAPASAASTCTTRRGRALQAGARHLHALGGPARRHRPAVLRRPARRGGHARGQHRAHPDLLIGVVPVINLEWIQKLYRDKKCAATAPRR
jgi:hypothetical protein